jgi:hypothetical protein
MNVFRRLLIALVAMAAVGLFAPSAKADFAIKFSGGGAADQTVTWNEIDEDLITGDAIITFTGNQGFFQISMTVALSNIDEGGSPDIARMTISTVTIKNNDTAGNPASTLTITVSATDFEEPDGPDPLTLATSASGTVNAGTLTSTFTSYATVGGALFATSGTPTTTLSFNSVNAGTSFSDDTATLFNAGGDPYTLTSVGTYNLTAQGIVVLTGGGTWVTAAPEPSTLVIALAGFPVLGLRALRRRLRKESAPA